MPDLRRHVAVTRIDGPGDGTVAYHHRYVRRLQLEKEGREGDLGSLPSGHRSGQHLEHRQQRVRQVVELEGVGLQEPGA